MAYGSGGKGHRGLASDHPLTMDIQCTLALGISCGDRTLEGSVRLRALRHYANLPYRGCHTYGNLSSSHMVRILSYGQYDPDDKQAQGRKVIMAVATLPHT